MGKGQKKPPEDMWLQGVSSVCAQTVVVSIPPAPLQAWHFFLASMCLNLPPLCVLIRQNKGGMS